MSAPKYYGHDGADPASMEAEPGRKHPVHMPLVTRHNEPVIVFLTVCSKDRKRIFARPDIEKIIADAWHEAKSWLVGRYVIMPDHIHLFCAPGVFPSEPLNQWVRYWKTLASRKWPRQGEYPLWQREFWDTQLRRHENYSQKCEYVLENPVRAGLAKKSDEWPFHGELNILRW